jgi:antitoxin ParD1/3/4
MNITLKPEIEQFIQAQLATGRFASAEDVINEAFKLLQERERRIEELRQKIAVGNEQIAKGQVTDGEVVFARLQEKIQDKVASGRYENTEQVIRLALKLLEEWDKGYQEWIEETRQKVEVGFAEIERGEVLDGETVVMQILERLQKAREFQE